MEYYGYVRLMSSVFWQNCPALAFSGEAKKAFGVGPKKGNTFSDKI
jgi:hypothetical protein